MSNFKASGIILKIKKIDDKKHLYTIFTQEYGKILCNKNLSTKEKALDIGYIIQFEVGVVEGINIHKIKHIKILGEFTSIGVDFNITYSFLSLLSQVHRQLPENLQHSEVYSTITELIDYKHNYPEKFTSQKILLISVKIQQLLGYISREHSHPIISKILHYTQKNKAPEILKLTGLSPDIEEQLKTIINL